MTAKYSSTLREFAAAMRESYLDVRLAMMTGFVLGLLLVFLFMWALFDHLDRQNEVLVILTYPEATAISRQSTP